MTPERWRQIEQLYYAALECEASQRAILLEHACGGDEALRREVEALLADLRQLRHRLEQEAEPKRSIEPHWSGKSPVDATKEPEAQTGQREPTRPTSSAEIIISQMKRHKKGAAFALAAHHSR